MGAKLFHISIDVRGALSHWRPGDWREFLRGRDGQMLNPDEVRQTFQNLADAGINFVALGECDRFDPVHGCPGHDVD